MTRSVLQSARQRAVVGALKAAKAITTTFGPMGRTALIQRMSGLITTKDGLTVAREIFLEDPVENMGARILKEACQAVNKDAGDGTTTTAIIAANLIKNGHALAVAGVSIPALTQGMKEALEWVLKSIDSLTIPVESQDELEQVIRISCNGEEKIPRLMAEACMAVGTDGTLLIEDGQGVDSVLEFKDGMEIERNVASRAFLHDQNERVIEGALVAVINFPLRSVDDVKEILEVASQWPRNELLVFAPVIEREALLTMTVNDSKAVVKCCGINTSTFKGREILQDVAALSGARMIEPLMGEDFRQWDAEWFGAVRKATIKPKITTLIAYEDKADSAQRHQAELRHAAARCTSDHDRDEIWKRISKLSGGLAILKIGGVTEAALKEQRARVEDALGSARAALKGGIIPGGGTALWRAAFWLDDRIVLSKNPDVERGWKLLSQALRQPLRVLAESGGHSGATVGDSLTQLPIWTGWDVRDGIFRDLRKPPMIVDAALMAKSAITAAVSVASTLLSVEGAVFKT